MRRGQTALIIVAALLIAGSLLPLPPRLRLACAGAAIAIVLLVFFGRLRALAGGHREPAPDAMQTRLERRRAQRAGRRR